MGRGHYYRCNKKDTTADYRSIKIADMNRYKALSPGWHSWQWSRNGEKIGSVSFTVTEDTITFRYSTKDRDGSPLDVNKAMRLTWTPCNYGGRRSWFVCGCGRRVARLFIYRQHVACRHCFNLTYDSRNEDQYSLMLRREDKLYERLGGDRLKGIPPKPKGMHWRTYEKLSKVAFEQSMKGWEWLGAFVERLKR